MGCCEGVEIGVYDDVGKMENGCSDCDEGRDSLPISFLFLVQFGLYVLVFRASVLYFAFYFLPVRFGVIYTSPCHAYPEMRWLEGWTGSAEKI